MFETTDETRTEQPESPELSGGLSESARHWALSDERRRILLEELSARQEPVELDDLASAIARAETAREPGPEARRRLSISLHHVHLPKLAEFGVVTYDPHTRRVSRPGESRSERAR